MQWALRAWKIDPRRVTILQSGATNARMTALVLGQIDATILSYPDIHVARKRGMNVLADIGDFSAYPNTSLLVTRALLEKQRPLAKNLLRSQMEAIHYMKTNRSGSIQILRKYLRVNDAEAIEATYDFFRAAHGAAAAGQSRRNPEYSQGDGSAAAQSRRFHRYEPDRGTRARGLFSKASLSA